MQVREQRKINLEQRKKGWRSLDECELRKKGRRGSLTWWSVVVVGKVEGSERAEP